MHVYARGATNGSVLAFFLVSDAHWIRFLLNRLLAEEARIMLQGVGSGLISISIRHCAIFGSFY